MRVLLYNSNDAKEAAERRRLMGRIDAWWCAFSEKQTEIDLLFKHQAHWDLPHWMNANLNSISPELMWEYGPAVRCKGHRLVITPETHKHLRPLVNIILSRAPKLPNWEFYAYRLPEPPNVAQMTVNGRTGGSIEDVAASASIGDDGRINLTFYSPRCKSPEDQQARHDAFIATESLLGEEILDKWIGLIEIRPMPQQKRLLGLFKCGSQSMPSMISLDRLKPTVDSLISSVIDQLPPKPLHTFGETLKWNLLELKPKEAADYPGQRDMIVGKTAALKMWRDAHSGASVYSERYSRCGETFCFVKLDGSKGLQSETFEDKAAIEDALDAALKPSGLGCVIGGGTGLRYSYVDLALTDIRRGVNIVRSVLSKGTVPKRSWLLFYDTVLAQEWVGVYDDSPMPPM